MCPCVTFYLLIVSSMSDCSFFKLVMSLDKFWWCFPTDLLNLLWNASTIVLFHSASWFTFHSQIIPGKNLFFIGSRGNLHRGLGSRPFKITPTRWCENGCAHVRPHPDLTNLEFGRVHLYFH